MSLFFSRQHLNRKEFLLQRIFEILPGATSWFLILGIVALSLWKPIISSVIVIAFLLAWVLRLFYLTIILLLSYARLLVEKRTNWLAWIRGMDHFEEHRTEINRLQHDPTQTLTSRISLWLHGKNLKLLEKKKKRPPSLKDIYHLVIIPVVKEGRSVIEANVASIAANQALLKRIVIVIALEERAHERIKEEIRCVAAQYRECFFDFLVIQHPDGLLGEARVKGANITFAAKAAAGYFHERHISFENIIVSCFDSDTVVGPDYFSCLTYCFMVCPDRNRASFQPIPVYHNNIWKVPGFARVVETGSSFFQLIETTDPDRLVTFSSHSMSFQALVEAGYWPVDMISDDSGIFWKSYLYFNGNYRVVPIPTTLSMDVVDAGSWWRTVVSLYKQKRRWAWGVENFPLVMRGFLQDKKIPLYHKIQHAFKLFEGHVTWAAVPFLLTFVGWLPALFAGREFSHTVLYYSAARITQAIFSLSFLALLSTIIISLWLLPKKNVKYPILWSFIHAAEWLLVPFILVFLSALPALDAQTRMMFNRRMEFWVADKRAS